MPSHDLTELLTMLLQDGMLLKAVRLPTREVVYFKSVLEAHPAVATVHAAPGPVQGEYTELYLATTKGLQAELDGIMKDLGAELPLSVSAIAEVVARAGVPRDGMSEWTGDA